MKKVLLIITGFFFSLLANSQDLLNHNFENWETTFDYEEPDYDNFLGSTIFPLVTGGDSINLERGLLNSSDALYLYSDTISSFSFALFGEASGEGDSLEFSNGTPFDQLTSPHSLRFTTEYDLAVGDTGSIFVSLSRNNTVISLTLGTLLGQSNGIDTVTIVLDYPIIEQADSFVIGITSDSPDDTTGVSGKGYLAIDNLVFLDEMGDTAQTIPYGGFDDWTRIVEESPVDWTTSGSILPTDALSKDSINPIEGLYSVGLLTTLNPFDNEDTLQGIAILGTLENDSILPGFALTKEYESLVISYSYETPSTQDSAQVIFGAVNSFTAQIVGGAVKSYGSTGGMIVTDTIPLLFFASADSAFILLKSSAEDSLQTLGSYFVVDKLKLIEKVPVGLIDNSISESGLYPNPTTGLVYFTEEASKIKVYTLNGALLINESINNSIDLNLQKGAYFYEVFDKDHQLLSKSKLLVE